MLNRIGRNDQALQKFTENYKELTLIIYKQEKQIRFLETKALYLSIFYVASQLAIFLSNLKASAYHCRNWWKPFGISFTIAVVFGLNFSNTILKYIRTKYEQDRNFIDQGENYLQMTYLERNGTRAKEGTDSYTSFEVDMSKVDVDNKLQQQPDMFAVYLRYAHLGVTSIGLLAFTVLVLHTCGSSVCAEAA